MLAQRARLFGWIEGQHLDFNDGSKAEAQGDMEEAQAIKGYLKFAGQGPSAFESHTAARKLTHPFPLAELLKVNHYKAPRDKLICILNCCKVIFGTMFGPPAHLQGDRLMHPDLRSQASCVTSRETLVRVPTHLFRSLSTLSLRAIRPI